MTCKEAVRARGASRGHVQLSSTSFFSPSGTEVQKMPPEESGELTTGDGLHFTFFIYRTTSFSLNAGNSKLNFKALKSISFSRYSELNFKANFNQLLSEKEVVQ